jgi:DUF1009 family protein
MTKPDQLGLIAGQGRYPVLLAESARASGLTRLSVVGFPGETDPILETLADHLTWLKVGQLSKMIHFFLQHGIRQVIMAGQVAPKHLFDLKPDFRALTLLARLKERNAESIFRGIAEELAREGIELLPATTFLESSLASEGLLAGPPLKKRQREDVRFGFRMAKEMARLDIGQSVVVKQGTVLAVEAFEGTDACMRRGGPLGRGEAILVKVSKRNQDFRFDVPVVGVQTIQSAQDSGIRVVACETGCTLLLDRPELYRSAAERKITLVGISSVDGPETDGAS